MTIQINIGYSLNLYTLSSFEEDYNQSVLQPGQMLPPRFKARRPGYKNLTRPFKPG